MRRLGTYFNLDENGDYSERIKHELSKDNINVLYSYAASDQGASNCMGFTFLLNQILLELKIPATQVIGYTKLGYHANAYVLVNGKLEQATLQEMLGFAYNKKISFISKKGEDGLEFSIVEGNIDHIKPNERHHIQSDEIFIYTPDNPESFYVDAINGLTNLYNNAR